MSEAYKRNLAVPFFTQRDNTYIWQQIDADTNLRKGPKYPMAWRSCNITSLCMVLHYWGLTEESPDQMLEKVFEKEEWGWSEEEYCRDTEKRTNAFMRRGGHKMKKTVLTIAAALLVTAAACAAAPELRNMMPNSWEKLTRLTAEEEKEFIEKEEVRAAAQKIKYEISNGKESEEIDCQVFTETNCGLEFYRLLMGISPLENAYKAEYRDKVITQDEYMKMQFDQYCCVWQIVFIKKGSYMQSFFTGIYGHYWTSQGKRDWYRFNDLMIKPLEKDKVGLFMTDAIVSFIVDRRKMDEDKIIITYDACKKQTSGLGSCEFLRVKNEEDFVKALRDNDRRVRIQASDYLFDSRCPFKYSIQNAFDGNPATSYVENTEDDLFLVEIGATGKFEKLAVINGYALNESLYKANNRVKGVSGGVDFADDNMNYQVIKCLGNYLPFDVIYKGEKYDDTCLAELNLFVNKNWLFGEINE